MFAVELQLWVCSLGTSSTNVLFQLYKESQSPLKYSDYVCVANIA